MFSVWTGFERLQEAVDDDSVQRPVVGDQSPEGGQHVDRVGVGDNRRRLPAHVAGADRRRQDRRRAGAFDARLLLGVGRHSVTINSPNPPALYSTGRCRNSPYPGLFR